MQRILHTQYKQSVQDLRRILYPALYPVYPIHWLTHRMLTCCLYWLATDTLPVRPAARKGGLTPTSVSKHLFNAAQATKVKLGSRWPTEPSWLFVSPPAALAWKPRRSGEHCGRLANRSHGAEHRKKTKTSACTSHCGHQTQRCEGEARPDLWTPTATQSLLFLLRHVSRYDWRDCATFFLLFPLERKNGTAATLTQIRRLMLNHGGMRKSGSGGAGSGRALRGDSLVDTKGETLGRQKAQEVGEKTERSHERREKALGKRSRRRIAQWPHFHRRPLVDGGCWFYLLVASRRRVLATLSERDNKQRPAKADVM